MPLSAPNTPTVAKVAFSVQAGVDLDDLFAFSLERFGFDAADDYFSGVQATCDRLIDFPELGPVVPDIRPPTRIVAFRHNIYYRFDGRTVLILRVLHHAMNAGAHLRR